MFSCLQLPQPCPNKYAVLCASVNVLCPRWVMYSGSGIGLIVTNKQGTSLIVVTCMDAYRNCIYHTHACTLTHTHASTLILS